MANDTAAPRSSIGFGALDNTDRILLGACVALWLGALGVAVAATVALVDLGRGGPPVDDGGTPWLLYTVIAVSAIVIVAAVPLLLRARRAAQEDAGPAPAPAPDRAPDRAPGGGPTGPAAPAARGTGDAGPAAGRRRIPQAVADRLWLRCGLEIGCAMGGSTILIGAATYLMAVDNNAAAWACYAVAAVITIAMPVIPWRYLREVRGLVGDDDQTA